jgi:hypothetical protein
MTIMDVGNFFIYAGAIATALLAIGALLRFVVVRPLLKKLRAELAPVQAGMITTVAEVTPDHGGSMKDQVTRTELKIDVLEERFKNHLINHPN